MSEVTESVENNVLNSEVPLEAKIDSQPVEIEEEKSSDDIRTKSDSNEDISALQNTGKQGQLDLEGIKFAHPIIKVRKTPL